MLIDGLHIPLTSPFYRDGRLYLRKLEHNVARYAATPAAGLVAFSSYSEPEALDDMEYHDSLQSIAALASPDKVLVAGITRASVFSSLRAAEQAHAAGFDAVLLGSPSLWAELIANRGLASLLGYFRAIADTSPLPVFLYSAAEAPGYPLPIDALTDLSRHPNIFGLFDAALTVDRLRSLQAATAMVRRDLTVTPTFTPVTRRMLQTTVPAEGSATFVTAESLSGGSALAVAPPKPALKTRTRAVGFQMMAAGPTSHLFELLENGAAGFLPSLAACAPQGCFEAFAAYKDGDAGLAAEKAGRLVEADALMQGLGIAGIKHGCDFNGYYGGSPRLPRLPLTAADRLQVERVLAGIRN